MLPFMNQKSFGTKIGNKGSCFPVIATEKMGYLSQRCRKTMSSCGTKYLKVEFDLSNYTVKS